MYFIKQYFIGPSNISVKICKNKIDEQDFVFLNINTNQKDDTAISEFNENHLMPKNPLQ